jgi:RNA polymerase sigma factor for flagellar operon FliA
VASVAQPADDPEVIKRFESTLDLVSKIAAQLMRSLRGVSELEDLVSYGQTGLLEAARRFDPTRGVPFRAYASIRIRGAMIDAVRALSPLPRSAFERLRGLQAMHRVAEAATEDAYATESSAVGAQQADRLIAEHLSNMATAMAIGMVARPVRGEAGEFIGASHYASPEEATCNAELRQIILEAIAELPDKEAQLVHRHYIDGDRFEQVAEELGLSKSWASRLHARAIARLSKRLRFARFNR